MRTALVVGVPALLAVAACGGNASTTRGSGPNNLGGTSGGGSSVGGGTGSGGTGFGGFVTGGDCSPSGTWAFLIEVGVEWRSATISPGGGTVKQWILTRIDFGADGQLTSTARACGLGSQNIDLGTPWFSTIEVPQLQIAREWTGFQFLPSLFDSGLLEDTPIQIAFSSRDPRSPNIGDDFTAAPAPFSFGLRGLDPTAPFPTVDQIAQYASDSDADANPGITWLPFSGHVPGEADNVMFSAPRLSIAVNPPPRANQLFLTLRTRVGLQGMFTSCTPRSGAAEELGPRLDGGAVPNTFLVETRIVSCTVAGTNELCLPERAAFVDSNLPTFNSAGTSRFVGLKVRDDIDCATVRSLTY